MKKYPIGIQDFEKLRQGGFVYVDKTDLVYKLTRGSVFFLSRPRRFGKSLLVSTLKYYFQGRKDLFEGLNIMELEDEWQQFPVLHFDFNRVSQPRALQEYVREQLDEWEKEYPFDAKFESLALRFDWLIKAAHKKTGRQVVVLIDEYDKPLLDLLETGNPDDERQLQQNRDFLKDFFSVFKAADEHLRFVLLTGITKFSQVSMFSGFNQPDDISIDTRFEALCGITEDELWHDFADSIEELADSEGQTVDETKAQLKQMFDGYHFSRKLTDIYNPFSLINTFAKNDIRSYWFKSGTPSYIVRLLARTGEDVMQFTGRYFKEQMFIDYKADREMPLPMIFQGGYLTIKAVDRRFNTYLLDFPNQEVREGFVTLLANNYLKSSEDPSSWVVDMVQALEQIHDRDYARSYEADPRPLHLIGASFSSQTGTVEEWQSE